MFRSDSSPPVRHGFIAGAAILSCTALMICVAPTAHAMYQQSDLQGVWESNSLASGPGAPWWTRVTVGVAPDGSFTATGTMSDGGSDTASGGLSISPDGIVTETGWAARVVLDADKTVMVATDTWSDGTTTLMAGTKMAGPYDLADLVGAWEVNSLASGPGAPWWDRETVTVAPDGSFSGSKTESGGGSGTVSGALSISSGGIVTIQGAPVARGTLDAGKTVLVMTDTWAGGTTELRVWTKMGGAGSYSLSDLVGTWEFNSLASGPGAPWWDRETVTVAPDGSFTSSGTESGGGGGTGSGVVGISPDGVFTISLSPMARGVLDVGKTVLVMTNTWSGYASGTTELSVGTKMSRGAVDVPPDASLAFALGRVRPNPSRGGALTVYFSLPTDAPARLELLDVAGRKIDSHEVGAGQHTLDLGEGRGLAPGLYLVRLTQGTNVRVTRVAVLK